MDQPPCAAAPTAAESPPPSPATTKTYELTACSIYYARPNSILTKLFNPCSNPPPPPPPYILRDVSLTAHPGELLAIVGPSGAGKSTLLDILAAHTSASHGSLLLNSSPLHPSTYRRLSAHVPQHDASLPLLTVAETFAFAARLLIPTPSIVPSTVSTLLSDLRLTHVSHTRVSGNLSGGERRRVSIGLSLLHDPGVLLLDEPTSGLDSSSAYNVLQSLRSIAASRRRTTVILSIHQPSSKILSAIDSILLLSKGSVIHHGTLASLDTFLFSAGFTVPERLNPLEYTLEIMQQLPATQSAPPAQQPLLPPAAQRQHDVMYMSSRAKEVAALYSRFWKVIFRSKQLLFTNTLQMLVVGVILGTIYIKVGYSEQGMEKRLGFFAFTLTFLLSSTTESLPLFVTERPILLREASSGVYRLSSHLAANTLVFMPYLLFISVLYATAVYFLVGLCWKWAAFGCFVMVVWGVVLAANSFVLAVAAVAPDYIAGTSVMTASLAGFFLFSGYFISREGMPAYWLFMHYMSPYKYGLDALLANEYGCESGRCFVWMEEGRECAVTGRDVMERRGLKEGDGWANLKVLFGFFLVYRLIYWVVLVRRASRSKK